MELVDEIYLLTVDFPKSELFGLSSQIKRASTSIVANIAEGFGRYTFADKAHKYVIARGECTEVEAFLHIAVRVKILTEAKAHKAMALSNRTGKLLSGLIQSCHRVTRS